ncbi:hypothetical protein BZA05DRAFT_396759, partial [Tricharina praecox]|uniref:uncharacterized protein n=1 Tax=Tricharina praecox TaxID=43433 RepID=UPI00221F61B6
MWCMDPLPAVIFAGAPTCIQCYLLPPPWKRKSIRHAGRIPQHKRSGHDYSAGYGLLLEDLHLRDRWWSRPHGMEHFLAGRRAHLTLSWSTPCQRHGGCARSWKSTDRQYRQSEPRYHILAHPETNASNLYEYVQQFQSPKAFRAMVDPVQAKLALTGKYRMNSTPIDPDGPEPRLRFNYTYEVTGLEFGLQRAPGLRYTVTRTCNTRYDWYDANSSTVDEELYFPRDPDDLPLDPECFFFV